MNRSKNQKRRRTTPATGRAKVLTALVAALLLSALAVVGQQMANNGRQFRDMPVEERIASVVKTKDARFELLNNSRSKGGDANYIMQGWKFGEEIIGVSMHEHASEEEAAKRLQGYVNAPLSVPVQTTKLTNLGDEAYITYRDVADEKGNLTPMFSSLFFRSGTVVVIMSGSSGSPVVAKRLAKHMTDAIGRRSDKK